MIPYAKKQLLSVDANQEEHGLLIQVLMGCNGVTNKNGVLMGFDQQIQG